MIPIRGCGSFPKGGNTDSKMEGFQRRGTARARVRLAGLANLRIDPWMQDWPLEVADSARVGEFLELYALLTDPDEKYLAMELLLCSLDEATSDTTEMWAEISGILRRECVLHAAQIIYWSCIDESEDGQLKYLEEGETFAISSRMRVVFEEVRTILDV